MNYKKMTNEDFSFLKALVGNENVTVLNDIEKDFAHDELGTVVSFPEAHVIVKEKNQVQMIMKYAYEYNIPVTVRGSGTGLVGACVPLFGGVLT